MNRRTVERRITFCVALVIALLLVVSASGQGRKKKTKHKPKKTPCAASFAVCKDQGCGSPEEADLNERKNIKTADLSNPEQVTLADLLKMKKPANYTVGGNRQPLTDAGEGKVVTTTAWLMDIRTGSQESCNCYFSEPINTDNHMVLLNSYVLGHYAAKDWEKHSLTAEFTPRVKQNGHPKFKRDLIRPLILNDPRGRLWVRITGTLMFDGYHEIHPLAKGRATNWEIHPVFRFEYCPPNKTCKIDSDTNWKNIEQ
jgi:hypothetical protein